ncbi:unnamed protein product [Pelagomonas calceolata]|uniref:Hexosyltransferase n=2 Tax=Pelagomonas calceolata TaxID=35677 RepID=A0A8J2WU32_9STRA|nr:unnamed protein product [Pelagomonas calceolata]
MHWAAFTLILLGAAAETDGGGEALAARRRLVTRPYFVPPPDLTKNWLVHGADHRGARADWNPVCRRYEARTPPLAAAAARLRSQDQSIKRGPAPTLEEPRVAGNATRTEDVVALVRTTWARYCRNVVPAYRTWAALLPDAYAVAQEPNRSHAWINELPREMLDYRRDIRPGEQKRGPKGVRVPLYYGWKLMRYGRRGTLSRPVVVASQCRHVSHRNPCCAADAQLRFAHDLLSRGSKAKWFLLVDDDVFVHTYALARALATLDPAKALAVVAPATRDRAGACAGLAAAALSRAALEAVGPAATGRGIDAACAALGSPQKALAAVLAGHGVDLLAPPARDVFVVGAEPDDYGALRDERREHVDLACSTAYPAPCATEAAETAPRRRLAAREQKRLPIEERRKIAPVAGQKKPPEPYRAPPPPTWRLREGCCAAAAAAEAPPAAGTCPRSQATAAWLAARRAS